MLYPLFPAFNRVARRLGWLRTCEELSERSWNLSPGCVRNEPPCLFDPEDLQRVTGYGVDGEAQVEERRIRGGPTEHGPTRAHLLRDVFLMNGHLFRPGFTMHLADAPTPWVGDRCEQVKERAVLACTHYGFRFFGHWLTDDLPLRLAAIELGDAVTWRVPTSDDQRSYARRLALEIDAVGPTHFRELVIVDDRGLNASRRQRMLVLRERMRGGSPTPEHPGVMLWRGTTGKARELANEEAVAERLRQRGFKVVRPNEQTFDEVASACAGARVAIGVEGSQLAHSLYGLAPEGAMVALEPPQRFGNIYKDYCDGIGLHYGFVVGHAQADGRFTIDLDQMERRLDGIEAKRLAVS